VSCFEFARQHKENDMQQVGAKRFVSIAGRGCFIYQSLKKTRRRYIADKMSIRQVEDVMFAGTARKPEFNTMTISLREQQSAGSVRRAQCVQERTAPMMRRARRNENESTFIAMQAIVLQQIIGGAIYHAGDPVQRNFLQIIIGPISDEFPLIGMDTSSFDNHAPTCGFASRKRHTVR
jgi:hypothetical protein